MKINQFTKALVPLLLVVVTAATASFSSNRLLTLSWIGQSGGTVVSAQQQRFQWEFSRDLAQNQDWKNLVRIEPALEGRWRAHGRTLIFTPTQPLLYQQEYRLEIHAELRDIYGGRLPAPLSQTLSTPARRFLYTEPGQPGDSLKVAELNSEHRLVAEMTLATGVIKEYASSPSGDCLVYSLQESDTLADNATRVFYLETRASSSLEDYSQSLEIRLPAQFNLNSLRCSGRELFFIARAAYEDKGVAVEDYFLSRAYRYGIDDQRLERFDILGSDLGNLWLLPDSSGLIYQRFDGEIGSYNLANAAQTLLAKSNTFGGMDYLSEQFAYLQLNLDQVGATPQVVRAQIHTAEQWRTPAGMFATDPALAADGRRVYFARRVEELDYAQGRFAVAVLDEQGTARDLATSETDSLELPIMSPDDSLLAVEVYSRAELQNAVRQSRNYLNPGRPIEAKLQIYEVGVEGLELSTEIIGYNLVWIR